ncbi:MAG: AI-2E family transporter [Pyrinomonadaceae bacterium]
MDPENRRDRNFVERVLITIGFVVLAVLLIALLYFTFDVILLLFAAVLLAIFLRGLADLLGRYLHIRESFLVLIVAAAMVAILAGAIAGLAPSIADQVTNLRDELPRSAGAARDYVLQYGWGRAILGQLPSTEAISQNLASSGMLNRVGGIFSSTVGAIANFFITILLAIYFAVEPGFYARGFTRLFPMAKRERVYHVLSAIGATLRWWLIGKAGSMLFIGVLTWIALSILGVPLALTLGLIAGLLSFIPNFGPILSAVPAILIAFVQSPMTAVYVVAIFVGVQLIESNIVTPLIERETVELPPGLTIIFQLALAVMVGGLGLVLATPLLAVMMVLIQMVYIQDVLGDVSTDLDQIEVPGSSEPALDNVS